MNETGQGHEQEYLALRRDEDNSRRTLPRNIDSSRACSRLIGIESKRPVIVCLWAGRHFVAKRAVTVDPADALIVGEVGPWAVEKHDRLRRYVDASSWVIDANCYARWAT
jgi:hypothetical protein